MKKRLIFICASILAGVALSAFDESNNLVRNGDFEMSDLEEELVGWTPPPKGTLIKKNNSFIQFIDNGIISQKITVNPEVKAFLISAKMRTSNLELGENSWNDARLNCYYKLPGEEKKYYTSMPTLKRDSDWKTVSVVSEVKQGADTLLIEPCILCKGVAAFDDIKVIPLLTNEEIISARKYIMKTDLLTLKNGEFIEGKFTKLDNKGLPEGWEILTPNGVKINDENGIKTLVLSATDPKKEVKLTAKIKPESEWKKIKISAKTAGEITQGAESWSAGKIQTIFWDYNNTKLSTGWPQFGNIIGTSDWKDGSVEIPVPSDDCYLTIEIGIIGGATGVFKVQDLKIELLN